MEKRNLSKLFALLSAGVVLAGCTTDVADETQEMDSSVEDTEEVADSTEEANEVTAKIDILIDGEQIADLSKEVTVPAGTYLMDVMHEEYDIVDDGGFLSVIEGYEQDVDAERYWLYYINDEMPSVGAGEYELEEGDTLEWRLEDSEF